MQRNQASQSMGRCEETRRQRFTVSGGGKFAVARGLFPRLSEDAEGRTAQAEGQRARAQRQKGKRQAPRQGSPTG